MDTMIMKTDKKNMTARERAWWTNLSLKPCFMAYMVMFAALGFAIIWGGMFVQFEVNNWLHDQKLASIQQELDETLQYEIGYGFSGLGLSVTYYENQIIDDWTGETESIMVREEFHPYVGWERNLAVAMDWMSLLGLPLCAAACTIAAGLLFYRNRLKRPIDNLTAAYAQVAAGNLEFELPVDRGDELGKLCVGFDAMRKALHDNNKRMWRAVEERRRLSAAFSHDLRTPLTVLSGYIQLLNRDDYPAEKRAETLAAMTAHINRLERYVADMNELNKLEDREPRREPVALDELAQRMIESARMLCEEPGHALEAGELPSGTALADAAMIERVFDNLISNATRFADGRVCISFEREGSAFSFTLLNDGAPFTPEQLHRAPEPYYTTDAKGGAHFGLGLSIARILCEKHGGALTLSNPPGGGAEVTASFDCPDR